MTMIKDRIYKIVNYIPLGNITTGLVLLIKNYLIKEGWIASVIKRIPIDNQGKEIPWFTYSSIDFISTRLNDNHVVFEYGSGNSTIWFSRKVHKITSIEHNKKWYLKIKEKILMQPNVIYLMKEIETGEYQNEILNYNKEFDIIVIDGEQRNECIINSLQALKDDGIIIWDNSDRLDYIEGYNFLFSNGFKKIDFWGLVPINPAKVCTSIFYRVNNCFKI